MEVFEIASMKALQTTASTDVETIQPKYQRLLDKFPEILEPNFKDLLSKHGVKHQIITQGPPCRAKLRPFMANSDKAIKGKEAVG